MSARPLPERIADTRDLVASLERKCTAANWHSEAVTAGGLTGYDPAVLSGIRRKPNHKADARRVAAYDRETALYRDLDRARIDLGILEALAGRESDEATLHSALTVEGVRTARFVRDRLGWHRVVRVSAKSVTVETGYSWTERLALDKVLEVRP